MFGSYMINFKEIADGVLKQQAAIQCQTTEDVVQVVLNLYQQPDYRTKLISKGKAFIRDNQGIVTRICELFEASLKLRRSE